MTDSRLMAAEQRVHAAIERLTPSYVAFLQALVRTPSPVGQEGPAQALVAEQLRVIGAAVEQIEVAPSRLQSLASFNRTPADYAGRPSVVGRWPGTGGGQSLILNAHIDTVPVDSPELWRLDPYGGTIEEGRLYGRGAWDDKAGVAECLLVAHAIQGAGVRLAGDLTVKSVIEDESSGNGTLACVERGHCADGVIIVDGTWPERFIVSHLGQVSFRIRLSGVAGHATSPGPNPIRAIGMLEQGLRECIATQNDRVSEPWGPHARPYFVNLGSIRGGVFPGSVPAMCEIEGQCGFPPPATIESMHDLLKTALDRIGRLPEWPLQSPPAIEFRGLETPPLIGSSVNPITTLLTNTVQRLRGAAVEESTILGHSDVRHYTRHASRPTASACLYGPGGGRNAHGADEYFELAHLPLVASTLASVALHWCGVSDTE
jgi:acetylornithine deacetylase